MIFLKGKAQLPRSWELISVSRYACMQSTRNMGAMGKNKFSHTDLLTIFSLGFVFVPERARPLQL